MQKFSGLKILIRNNQRMTYPLERDYHFLQNEFFPVFYLYIHIYVYLCPCDSSLTKRYEEINQKAEEDWLSKELIFKGSRQKECGLLFLGQKQCRDPKFLRIRIAGRTPIWLM